MSTGDITGTGPLNRLADLLKTPEKTLVGDFSVIFEVDWSVTLGQHKKFSSAKTEGLRYIETKLRDPE